MVILETHCLPTKGLRTAKPLGECSLADVGEKQVPATNYQSGDA